MRILAILCIILAGSVTPVGSDWLEWGGADRDFTVSGQLPPAGWPESGPKQLWRKPLGDGYSAILSENGVLYTMYRSGTDFEAVIALQAETGKVIWEYEQTAALWPDYNAQFGKGPHTTPIISGDNIYAIGVRGEVVALEKKTGKKIWSRKTWQELGAEPPGRGYASSPMVYDGRLIVPVGGKEQTLVAMDLASGKTVWKSGSYTNAFASPILINVDGQDQIVMFVQGTIVGFDARTGIELWSHGHRTKYEINASTPVWSKGNLLFMSSAYDTGGRMIRLSLKDGATQVEELWFERKFQVHHGSVVRIGDMLYGSHGDFGPAFLTSIDAGTVKIHSRQRGFGKTNLLAVGNQILLLDDDGTLAIANPDGDSLRIQASAQIFDSRTWTVPTLDGTRLYIRDQKEIVALDLTP